MRIKLVAGILSFFLIIGVGVFFFLRCAPCSSSYQKVSVSDYCCTDTCSSHLSQHVQKKRSAVVSVSSPSYETFDLFLTPIEEESVSVPRVPEESATPHITVALYTLYTSYLL